MNGRDSIDPRALPRFYDFYILMRRSIRIPKLRWNSYNLRASKNKIHPDNYDVEVLENGIVIETYRDLFPEELIGVAQYWT
jgi:hypothetical protein